MVAGPRAAAQSLPFAYSFSPSTKQISLEPASRWMMFRESDTITIGTTASTTIRVLSRSGAVVYQGAPTSRQFPRGHYFVETAGDRSQFCVLPNDYQGATFLGSIGDNSWQDLLERHQEVQNPWVRTGVCKWHLVEGQRGVFNWAEMDTIMANAVGKQVIAIAADVIPTWVGDSELVSRHTLYLQALATRYRGKLAAIEIWNEPSASKFRYNPNWQNVLYQLCVQGRTAIRAIDPDIRVTGFTFNNPMAYTDAKALGDMGLGAVVDAVSWHDYQSVAAAPDESGLWLGTGPYVPNVQDRVTAYLEALGNPTVDTYVDEIGLLAQSPLGIAYYAEPDKPLPSWSRGMARGIKYAVMYRAAGVDALVPHVITLAPPNMTDIGASAYGYEYMYRGPHPKVSAFLMTCHWLNGATLVDYRTLGDRVFLYAWRTAANTSLVVAWSREGQPTGLKTGYNIPVTDIFGTTIQPTSLGEEPVIFRSSSSDAGALLGSVMNALNETINVAPVFNGLPNQTVPANHPLQFTVAATDPDHEPVSYSVSPLPAGASFNSTTGLFSWTPSLAQAGAVTLALTATDARGKSSSTTTTVTVLGSAQEGLANRWAFDESSGTTASDPVGNMPGTLLNFNFTSTSGWVPGQSGRALAFDGANDCVTLANGSPVLTNNFTIAAWINPANATSKGTILSVRTAYGSSGLRLFMGDGRLKLDGRVTSKWQSVTFADAVLQAGAWQHVAVVYDKGVLTAYVNGVARGGYSWGESFVMNATSNNKIGAEYTDWFNGKIDNLLLYRRTLAPYEIGVLYRGNQAPVFGAQSSKTVSPGQTLSFVVAATDPDGDHLSYGTGALPPGAAFDPGTRRLTWTPTSSQTGAYTLSFRVSDGTTLVTQNVGVTVGSGSTATIAVADLVLVNADTGAEIQMLQDGAVLNLSALPPRISIRADTSPALVGSVRFSLNNGAIDRIENTAPYALLGDSVTTYIPWDAPLGTHTLVVTPYTLSSGAGTAGNPRTISFSVVNESASIAGVKIVNADNGTVVGTLANGAALDLGALPARISLRADTSPSAIGSVRFNLDDGAVDRVESVAPYALLGDSNNVYVPWEASAGSHTLVVTPYSQSGGGGAAGTPVTFTFSVIDQGAGVAGVTGVQIVNADDGVVVGTLQNGSTVDLATLPPRISLRADTAPAVIGSVRFYLDNGAIDRVENVAPYALLGDAVTTYIPWDAPLGSHTLVVTPCAEAGGGAPGTPLTLSFAIVNSGPAASGVTGLTVVNADNGAAVAALVNGMTLNPSALPPRISIRAETAATGVGSVRFNLDNGVINRVESMAPYALLGDSNNVYVPWTPTAGTHILAVTPYEFSGGGGSAGTSYQVSFTVSSSTTILRLGNGAPVLDLISNRTVNEGQNLAFTIAASDPDGDALTYSATSLPAGASFSAATRTFSWTPGYSQAGQHIVTFSVSDGSLTDSQTVTITVQNVNRAPALAALPSQRLATGQSLSLTVTGSDPDGDPLSYSASGLPAGASFSSATRQFAWQPAANQAGTYAVGFTVSDGTLTASQTLRLTVVEAGTGLLAEWPLEEQAGTTITNVVNGDVGRLVNFNFNATSGWVSWQGTDPGAALAFDGVDDVVTLDSARLGPVNDFAVLAWVYPVDLAGKQTVIALRTLLGASGLRVLIENGYLKAEGLTTAGLKTTSFTGVALTPGEWNLVAVVYDQATVRGYVNGAAAGSAAWGADLVMDPTGASQLGAAYGDYFQGTIDDVQVYGETLTAAEVLAIYDVAVNHAPVLAPIGNRTVRPKDTLTFTVSAADADGDPLTYSASGVPAGASFNTTSGVFSWSTKQPDAGTYTVTFSVSDGELTDSETITIRVGN